MAKFKVGDKVRFLQQTGSLTGSFTVEGTRPGEYLGGSKGTFFDIKHDAKGILLKGVKPEDLVAANAALNSLEYYICGIDPKTKSRVFSGPFGSRNEAEQWGQKASAAKRICEFTVRGERDILDIPADVRGKFISKNYEGVTVKDSVTSTNPIVNAMLERQRTAENASAPALQKAIQLMTDRSKRVNQYDEVKAGKIYFRRLGAIYEADDNELNRKAAEVLGFRILPYKAGDRVMNARIEKVIPPRGASVYIEKRGNKEYSVTCDDEEWNTEYLRGEGVSFALFDTLQAALSFCRGKGYKVEVDSSAKNAEVTKNAVAAGRRLPEN